MGILETDFIEALDKLERNARPSHLLQGIGDDTAVIKRPDHNLLFAADMLMDGTHFVLRDTDAKLVGRKALAVNLSDIAAMGGRPIAVTVSLAIPENMDSSTPLKIMEGIYELASTYNVAVSGGDTNVWQHPFVIDVAVVGEVSKKGPVLRSGAKPGDHIFVTGPLGLSLLGKHLRFEPRLKEAQFLHEHYQLTSMIDISDGIAKDLRLVLSASKCGAIIYEDKIPKTLDSSGRPCSTEQALTDGEDFELCFTLTAEESTKLKMDKSYPGSGLHQIGVMTVGSSFRFDNGQDITMKGYVHGRSSS
jgi:thiamine-monophosphate kinase